MARPKGEKGKCRFCGLEIGAGTKHPCLYLTRKEVISNMKFVVWYLTCKKCKETGYGYSKLFTV